MMKSKQITPERLDEHIRYYSEVSKAAHEASKNILDISTYARAYKYSKVLEHLKKYKQDIKHYERICTQILEGAFLQNAQSNTRRLQDELDCEAAHEFVNKIKGNSFF